MELTDGMGSGRKVGVDESNRLTVSSRGNERIYYMSRDYGNTYSIVAEDSAPAAAEYTLYIQNNADSGNFVIQEIHTYSVNTDCVWKLWTCTGTAAGSAVLTPVCLNTSRASTADLTVRGGTSTVTGLTAGSLLWQWHNGVAYNTRCVDFVDTIQIGRGQAVALEYDAGTGGAVIVAVLGYFDEE